MLVLSRKKFEAVVIKVGGETIRVSVVEVRGDKARLGFEAKDGVKILREELVRRQVDDDDDLPECLNL